MEKKREKGIKTISIILIIVIGFFGIRGVYAYSTDAKDIDGKGELTVYEISNTLDSYLKSQGKKMTHGSKEYIEYLSDLLTFEDDEEIKKISEYEDIKVYASIYLSEYDKEMIGADLGYILGFYPRMPKSMRDKTLQELKNESH